MLCVNRLTLPTQLGSMRAYAAELGILDFESELSLTEYSLLRMASYLESQGMVVAQIMMILRWLSTETHKFDPHYERNKSHEVITIVDKRWVMTLHRIPILDLKQNETVEVGQLPDLNIESWAINLTAFAAEKKQYDDSE